MHITILLWHVILREYFIIPDYEQIENCKKQDKNLGWTSYVSWPFPAETEQKCRLPCSNEVNCDFYAYTQGTQGFNCWMGRYKEQDTFITLQPLDTVENVTINFKKGEAYYSNLKGHLFLLVITNNFERSEPPKAAKAKANLILFFG